MKKFPKGLFFFSISFWTIMTGMTASSTLSYKIDPSQSDLTIHTSNTGLFAAAGHKLEIQAGDISGTLKLNPKDLSSGVLEMKVLSRSLKVNNASSEKDKKEIEDTLCGKVLECDQFPNITFKSTQVQAKDDQTHLIQGDLTLHGITQSLPLEVKIKHDPNKIEASGDFTLKQTDFKIKPPTALGGTIKVKNELKITFHIVAKP